MSDLPAAEPSAGGGIAPRNIDTVVYRVVHPLPAQGMPGPGARLAIWPQGEVFGVNVNGALRPIKVSDIGDWLVEGLIEPWVEEPAPVRLGSSVTAPVSPRKKLAPDTVVGR